MTIANVGHGNGRGRKLKFTPKAIEKIKELVATGTSRNEIAISIGVPLGSLQVTCSRLGISLRQKRNGTTPRKLNGSGKNTERASIAVTIRRRDKAVAIDIPITAEAMNALAFEAMWQDVGIAKLVGQILATVTEKDMVKELLQDATAAPSMDDA